MSAPNSFRRLLSAGVAAAGALWLAACGGGGGATPDPIDTQSCTAANCGTALVTLTDAAGDFQSYTVDISSLRLARADGTLVETLPATTRVDFAQLVDLSEVITARQIPPGNYVSGRITLDYRNAEIIAEDASGGSVQLAPVDGSGAALTTLEMRVELDNRNHLVITPGRVGRLAFDFDLEASNTVDLATSKVTVRPVLVASVQFPTEKDLRVRGLLQSVDVPGSSYTINVRPFHGRDGRHGPLVVHTTSGTAWEINGTAYTGAAGLTQLATLPADTMTIALGTLTSSDWSFTASRVLAGTSALPTVDGLRGDVIARSGNTLTVRGATLERRDGGVNFQRSDITLTVASTTKVTKEGRDGSYTIQDISVGQRIHATGNVGGSNLAPTFDATNGRVRLNITSLWGAVNARSPGLLALDLYAIEGRRPSVYNFSGTGTTPASDANPDDYQIATGLMPLASVTTGEVARVFGFVTPFGSAHPDFEAISRVDYSEVRAYMAIGWTMTGTATPFTTLSSSGLVANLDPAQLGERHAIKIGPVILDLLSLPASPRVVPNTSAARVLYAVAHSASRRVETYDNFADFSAALGTALSNGAKAQHLVAGGDFAPLSNTFTAVQMAVLLND